MIMTGNIHFNNKDNIDEKVLTFAVPGGKVYINDYYTNSPDSFLNISITGGDFEILCRNGLKYFINFLIEAG
jgi:hypothetical protein